MRICNQSVSNK